MIQRYIVQASSFAHDIDFVEDLIGVLVGFWFALATLVFLYFIIAFRKKGEGKAQWITGELKSEKRWITYPHMLVLVCDVFIVVAAVRVWVDVKQTMPEETTPIRIVSQQWAWTFVHPGPDGKLDTADDITKIDELHVQKDTTYRFELSSLDVVHDFSVPVFRLKQDAIPGRVIEGWFKPTLAGQFDIQCAEMCGIGHGLMPAKLYVEGPEEHAAWQARHAAPKALAALHTEPWE